MPRTVGDRVGIDIGAGNRGTDIGCLRVRQEIEVVLSLRLEIDRTNAEIEERSEVRLQAQFLAELLLHQFVALEDREELAAADLWIVDEAAGRRKGIAKRHRPLWQRALLQRPIEIAIGQGRQRQRVGQIDVDADLKIVVDRIESWVPCVVHAVGIGRLGNTGIEISDAETQQIG